jgi:type IV secretion system protein TrbL
MNPDEGILTALLNAFINVFSGGFGLLTPRANTLLGLLAAIEIAIAGLFWALKGQDFTAAFIKKLLHIGFFVFLVANWADLSDMVVKSFALAGSTAAGGTGVNLADPSWIIEQGLLVSTPISGQIDKLTESTVVSPMAAFSNLGQIIQYGLAMLVIIIAFFIIAIQCFIVFVEFYIVAVLGLILVPFGVNKHTAFLAEKAIGAVIAQGVKVMVLAFILSVTRPLLVSMTAGTEPTIVTAFMIMLGVLAIAMLSVHAPAMAGGLLSGSPSLTAGSAASTAIGAAAGAAGMGMAAGAAKNAVGAGAGKTIQAAGAMSEAGNIGATAAAGAGAGPVGVVAARIGSAAYAGAKQVGSKVESLGDRMKERFQSGKLDGARYMGNQDAGKQESQQSDKAAENTKEKNKDSGMMAAHSASTAITHLSNSGGGGSATLTLPKDTDEA